MKKRMKFSSNKKKIQQKKFRYKTYYKKTLEYESGDYFKVEKIIDKKGGDDDPYYLVKWEGWSDNTNTWEPIKNLKNVRHLIEAFELSKDPKKDLKFFDLLFPDDSGSVTMESEPDGEIQKDVPEKIVRMYESDGIVYAEIRWSVRKRTGFQPYNTVLPRDELKKKYIVLLLEFYESRIKFM